MKLKQLTECKARYARAWVGTMDMVEQIHNDRLYHSMKTILAQQDLVRNTMFNGVMKGIADEYERLGGIVYTHKIIFNHSWVNMLSAAQRGKAHYIMNGIVGASSASSQVQLYNTTRMIAVATQKEAGRVVDAAVFSVATEFGLSPTELIGMFYVEICEPACLPGVRCVREAWTVMKGANLSPPKVPYYDIVRGKYKHHFL